jgi:formylglycine-generating enzyme required for sulfatase activity
VVLATPALPRQPPQPRPDPLRIEGWPESPEHARQRQTKDGPMTRSIELGDGVSMTLVRIPVGRYVMGSVNGQKDEYPQTLQTIEEPFWMGQYEVSNRQFKYFDPSHDSRLEHGDFLQFSVRERGYPLNHPEQPTVRVSWEQAKAFCRWLSRRTGQLCDLPTEAQWEYACRAGTATPLWFGELAADFSDLANLADASLQRIDRFGWGLPIGAVPPWRPAVTEVNDGHRVAAPVTSAKANVWGLHHMHGNAAEWTRSAYRPYPYRDDDGRNAEEGHDRRVVRGGSWYDRPSRARSAFRLAYHPWQRVYNVGFRIVVSDAGARVAASASQ